MTKLTNLLNNNQGVIGFTGLIIPIVVFIFGDFKSLVANIIVVPVIGKPIVEFLMVSVPVYSIVTTFLFLLVVRYLYFLIALHFSKFTITKAVYGANGKYIDIAINLNEHIKNNKLNIKLTNSIIGNNNDPMPHTLKTCEVHYQIDKKSRIKRYDEGEYIKLPKISDYLSWL